MEVEEMPRELAEFIPAISARERRRDVLTRADFSERTVGTQQRASESRAFGRPGERERERERRRASSLKYAPVEEQN